LQYIPRPVSCLLPGFVPRWRVYEEGPTITIISSLVTLPLLSLSPSPPFTLSSSPPPPPSLHTLALPLSSPPYDFFLFPSTHTHIAAYLCSSSPPPLNFLPLPPAPISPFPRSPSLLPSLCFLPFFLPFPISQYLCSPSLLPFPFLIPLFLPSDHLSIPFLFLFFPIPVFSSSFPPLTPSHHTLSLPLSSPLMLSSSHPLSPYPCSPCSPSLLPSLCFSFFPLPFLISPYL
jgi:hypothetical protein